jgi:two-component system sensor histidine kinase CiaH
MFRYATIRLTGWYVLVLMTLSLMLSIVIYQVASDEVETRLENFETSLQRSPYFNFVAPGTNIVELRNAQYNQATANIIVKLVYFNILLLITGSLISYYLARRSLIPIEQAHEAQSRFTSDASHELRTPLTVMKTELEIALMDDSATVDSLKSVLASNLEEVDKLTKLSQMLLSLSQSDHSNVEIKKTNFQKIVLDVVKDFKLPEGRISVDTKKSIIVCGNETALSELIKILIDNAVKYSPAESLIKIHITKQDHNAVFSITNTGPGIKKDKLPHIFDRFYRADTSRTNGPQKGYGLGLALAKKITEIHYGSISATSTPNRITKFTVTIPLVKRTRTTHKN